MKNPFPSPSPLDRIRELVLYKVKSDASVDFLRNVDMIEASISFEIEEAMKRGFNLVYVPNILSIFNPSTGEISRTEKSLGIETAAGYALVKKHITAKGFNVDIRCNDSMVIHQPRKKYFGNVVDKFYHCKSANPQAFELIISWD